MPERYLEHAFQLKLAMGCMERVQSMPSRQFNLGSCQYLAIKLKLAVQRAQEYLMNLLRAQEYDMRSHSPKIMNPGLEGFRFLLARAKEVERFIQRCCEDQWVLSAMIMTNALEEVSMIGFDLDLVSAVFSQENRLTVMLAELSGRRKAEDDIIGLRAKLDQNRLVEKIKALVQSSNPGSDRQLAPYLLARLTAAMGPPTMAGVHGSGGSSLLSLLKVDYNSLEPHESLGTGTAGIVHKTEWLGGLVAEKTFFDSDQPSFEKEVSALAGLSHPHMVPLLGYATGDGDCSILMELMDQDLFHLMRTRLRRDRSLVAPFSVAVAVDIMLQIAQAVRYLHDRCVMHRDLKAHNILVNRVKDVDTNFIHVKIADFGLSRTKERSSTYSNQTMSIGTSRWMAPELMVLKDPGVAPSQAMTSNLKDVAIKHPFKADIYSFGMVCYEILTGSVPFHSISSLNEVKRMVLNGHRPVLPDVCPLRLKALIESCWHAEARARPSFGEICAQLRFIKCVLLTGGDVDDSDPMLQLQCCEGRQERFSKGHTVLPVAYRIELAWLKTTTLYQVMGKHICSLIGVVPTSRSSGSTQRLPPVSEEDV